MSQQPQSPDPKRPKALLRVVPVMVVFLLQLPDFTSYIEVYSYLGILFWYLTFDNVVPLPQEVSLMIIGYLSAQGHFNPLIAGVVALIGFVIMDSAYFMLARSGSSILGRRHKKPESNLMHSLRIRMQRAMVRTYCILSFIPRARLFGPIIMGSLKISYPRFLALDVAVLSVFTAIYLSLGFFYYKTMYHLVEQMELQHHLTFALLLIFLAVFLVFMSRKIKKKLMDKEEAEH